MAVVSPEQIAVAIKTPHGPIVKALMDRGIAKFALNPKQLDCFRNRFSTAEAKDDRRDALMLPLPCAPTATASAVSTQWTRLSWSFANGRAWPRNSSKNAFADLGQSSHTRGERPADREEDSPCADCTLHPTRYRGGRAKLAAVASLQRSMIEPVLPPNTTTAAATPPSEPVATLRTVADRLLGIACIILTIELSSTPRDCLPTSRKPLDHLEVPRDILHGKIGIQDSPQHQRLRQGL